MVKSKDFCMKSIFFDGFKCHLSAPVLRSGPFRSVPVSPRRCSSGRDDGRHQPISLPRRGACEARARSGIFVGLQWDHHFCGIILIVCHDFPNSSGLSWDKKVGYSGKVVDVVGKYGSKLDNGWPESEKDVFQAALSMVVVKNSR